MRVRGRIRAETVAAGLLYLLASTTSISLAGMETRSPAVDAAIRALISGDREKLVSLFRYFEGAISPNEVKRDRQVVGVYFDLLKEHFGRPERLEPTQTTAPGFVNIYIESATPDLWRNSDCVFRAYAFRTGFADKRRRYPAEVVFDVCFDRANHAWLRKVDVHLSNPDEETVRRAQLFFRRFRQEVDKVSGPRT